MTVVGDRVHHLVDQFGGRVDLPGTVPINYLTDGASDHRVGVVGYWLLIPVVLLRLCALDHSGNHLAEHPVACEELPDELVQRLALDYGCAWIAHDLKSRDARISSPAAAISLQAGARVSNRRGRLSSGVGAAVEHLPWHHRDRLTGCS